jgi:hypothetical protein
MTNIQTTPVSNVDATNSSEAATSVIGVTSEDSYYTSKTNDITTIEVKPTSSHLTTVHLLTTENDASTTQKSLTVDTSVTSETATEEASKCMS